VTLLRPGDVVAVFDATTRPPKTKRMIAVAVAEGWFLRINTRELWRPHLPMAARENPGCLDHDSFIELRGLLDLDMDELSEMLDRREAQVLGRIGAATARALVAAVGATPTFRAAEVERIVEELRGLSGSL
jgi:hypothetical protein